MNNFKISKLTFDDRSINFKDGINYIVGLNGSGKTTFFRMIQYLLGLRKDFGFYIPFLKGNSATLDISVGNINYEFCRDFTDKEVQVSFNGQRRLFNVNNIEFYDFLITLFQPKYNFELTNNNVITSLIKESFLSAGGIDTPMTSTFQKEISLFLLGVNSIYPKKIKNYLRELKVEVDQREMALSQLKSFKEDTTFLLNREIPSQSKVIDEVFTNTFQKFQTNFSEAIAVYEQSKSFVNKMQTTNQFLLEEKIDQLKNTFTKYLNYVLIEDRVSLNDVLDSKELGYSYSKKTIINLILAVTIQSNWALTNGVGLIVNDSGLLNLNTSLSFKFRDLIKQVCKDTNFQYIEFVTSANELEKYDIVFDLGKGLKHV